MEQGSGFLGTKASFAADSILSGSIIVAIMLTVGAYLAIQKRYEAHRRVQTAAVSLNLVLVLIMISLLIAVKPEDFAEIRPIAFIFLPAHEFIGVVGFLFGGFVTLRGNELVPARLKFSNYKLFMRIAYGLYMAATVAGIASYMVLYT